MFHRQTGCLPSLTFGAGLFIAVYSLAAYLYSGYYALTRIFTDTSIAAAIGFPDLLRIVFVAVVTLFFPYMGLVITDSYPAIKVDDSGLFVKNLFSIDHFTWNEVRRIENARGLFSKGIKAVVLQPNGNAILNFIRYYPYFMHGTQAGVSWEPVVLLSINLPGRDEILKVIHQHLRENINAQISLPLID